MGLEVSDVVGLVLHFRTPLATLACLESLCAEGIRRVVIVDNSQDEGRSWAQMRAGLERLDVAGLWIGVITCERNLGFARGVNVGLVHACDMAASVVLLINSDARLEIGSLKAMLRCYETAALVIPRVRARTGAQARSLFGFYHRSLALILTRPFAGCERYASGCCMLLNLRQTGISPFDDSFFFYGEDVMLAHVLRARGLKEVECRDAFVVHASSGSAKNGSLFYEYHINRSHWRLARRLAVTPWQRLSYPILRCVMLPMRATFRSARFRSLTPWRGLIAATIDALLGHCRSFTP